MIAISTTPTTAKITDAATGALIRNVRLGKNHPALVSIARALESNYPGMFAAFDCGQSPLGVAMYRKIAPNQPVHRFNVELRA